MCIYIIQINYFLVYSYKYGKIILLHECTLEKTFEILGKVIEVHLITSYTEILLSENH